MTDKELAHVFIKFLAENAVLFQFYSNLTTNNDDKNTIPKLITFSQHNKRTLIDVAFKWLYTKEGHAFWSHLNDDWLIYYKYYKIYKG